MSVILKKEDIQTNDVICQKYNRTTVESDVIVPDVNPDILKVLDVSGYITVTEKSIRSGKIYIRGTVNMTVLYAPERASARLKGFRLLRNLITLLMRRTRTGPKS